MMFKNELSRRGWLTRSSAGFGLLALRGMLAESVASEADAAVNDPLAPKPPHFAPRAKRAIFLCMRGGPSHMETFDYKPKLTKDNGKPGRNGRGMLRGSKWKFGQHGQSGLWISELLPHLSQQADRLCVLNGMHTDNEAHPQALEQMHTGSFQFIRPSLGSWVLYGLGTENRNLPGFISLNPITTLGGLRYYSNAFLPAMYSATLMGKAEEQKARAQIEDLENPQLTRADQRQQLDLLREMNSDFIAQQSGDSRVEGLIDTFELAFRMQTEVPKVVDISGETEATLRKYGIDQNPTDAFGRQCLLARRMIEEGVRFVEVTHTDWDHHAGLTQSMPRRCAEIDRPIAGLLSDLAERGLLDETLVVWGGEFGRSPDDPSEDGRGHNREGFTMWMAGGGTKGGFTYGMTDEYGYEAIDGRMHTHDLHATMLHLLGLDHEQLTYQYGGRPYRLTDVYGRVVKEIMA